MIPTPGPHTANIPTLALSLPDEDFAYECIVSGVGLNDGIPVLQPAGDDEDDDGNWMHVPVSAEIAEQCGRYARVAGTPLIPTGSWDRATANGSAAVGSGGAVPPIVVTTAAMPEPEPLPRLPVDMVVVQAAWTVATATLLFGSGLCLGAFLGLTLASAT